MWLQGTLSEGCKEWYPLYSCLAWYREIRPRTGRSPCFVSCPSFFHITIILSHSSITRNLLLFPTLGHLLRRKVQPVGDWMSFLVFEIDDLLAICQAPILTLLWPHFAERRWEGSMAHATKSVGHLWAWVTLYGVALMQQLWNWWPCVP